MALDPAIILNPGHVGHSTIGAEWRDNPFIRLWRGLDAEGSEPCTALGEPATLVLWGDDYDGGYKAWVRWPDGRDDIVPGSRVERRRVRGILIVVERDWLELVERESRESFALGRLDRSQPAWTQPGDPWLLATGDPPLVVASAPLRRVRAADGRRGVRPLRLRHRRARASSTRSRSCLAGRAAPSRPTSCSAGWRSPTSRRSGVRRAHASSRRSASRLRRQASPCASTTPRSPRSSAPEEAGHAVAIDSSATGRTPAPRRGAPAGRRRAGRRDRRRTRRLGRARCRLVRPDHEHGARRDRSRRHDDRADGARGKAVSIEWVGDMVLGSSYGLPPDGGRGVAGRRDADAPGRRPHVREPRGDDVDDVGLEVRLPARPTATRSRRRRPTRVLLKRAGFDIVNQANNHAFDFGATGRAQTRSALATAGVPGRARPARSRS